MASFTTSNSKNTQPSRIRSKRRRDRRRRTHMDSNVCRFWVKSRHSDPPTGCPLHPEKQTLRAQWEMSAKCHKRTSPQLFGDRDERQSRASKIWNTRSECPFFALVTLAVGGLHRHFDLLFQ